MADNGVCQLAAGESYRTTGATTLTTQRCRTPPDRKFQCLDPEAISAISAGTVDPHEISEAERLHGVSGRIQFRSCESLEKHYGDVLRSTPEYQNLGY